MYLIQFIRSFSKLIFISLTQLKKSEWACIEYLKSLEITYDGQFDPSLIKKVAKFQSIQLHFVANAFSGLYQRKNNVAEMKRNMQYFLMTVLYDELIDEDKMDALRLDNLFYHPSTTQPSNFKERVLIAMHLELLQQVKNQTAYWEVMEKVHLAQKDSAKQFDANTSLKDILDITVRKGGNSLLMCRHYLMDPVNEKIDITWYALGGLIQMTNDLYDTYKDTQLGIRTFANQAENALYLSSTYSLQKKAFKNSIQQLPFDKATKQEFCIKTAIIAAFGDVALHQLEGLQANSVAIPNFNAIPRNSLIIDMEKTSNIIKLLQYAYKNGKIWM